MARRRLGRGLDALLGRNYDSEQFDPAVEQEIGSATAELASIAIARITPNPYQPRKEFDPVDLASLAESIEHHGMLQPVLLRRLGDHFQLVVGERRLRAAQQAGLDRVPARIIEVQEHQLAELAMVENLQRTDLNAMEKAMAFRDHVEKFQCTQDELAARLGLDRSTISNFIRLLELPESIQQAVQAGKLSQGHARALVGCADPTRQHELCQRIVRDGLSVRQTEKLLSSERGSRGPKARRDNPHRTSHVSELQDALRERLGTHVEIRLRGKDRGQIVIDFATNDDFERIMAVIHGHAVAPVAA